MSPLLVVTRPREDAANLVDTLSAAGHDVVAFPVLGIEPVADPTPLIAAMTTLSRYRLAIFVSPNAIRHALAHRPGSWPPATAIGVMGPGSVATLAARGIAVPAVDVFAPTGPRYDSEALLEALGPRAANGPILIVKGSGGRTWLADRLRADGATVETVEAYRRVRPAPDPDGAARLRAATAEARPIAYVVTSTEGLGHLVTMLAEVLGDPAASRCSRVYASHARIADAAQAAGFTDVVLTPPGDAGLVASIK